MTKKQKKTDIKKYSQFPKQKNLKKKRCYCYGFLAGEY